MQLRIERPIYGGAGLAHTPEGEAVFVPFALPEEVVEVDRFEGARESELLHVLEPSAERVAPRCVHFGVCGGCQYQHAAYDTQLRMKADILLETMERAGVRALPEIAVHAAGPHSEKQWGYRNRIRLRVATVDGVLRAGYSLRSSNEFLPITMCPIAAPVLWQTVEAILKLAAEDSKVRGPISAAAEMELFCTAEESKVQLSFFFDVGGLKQLNGLKHTGGLPFAQLCERIQAAAPIVGAGIYLKSGMRAISQGRWGADGLLYEAAEARYWVSRGSFFQVNRFLVDTMVQIATGERSGTMAWDLYAGVGLFSRRLVEQFDTVVGVETGEPAVNDLRAMLTKTGPNHRAEKTKTVEYLRGAVIQRERPDLVLMDPPRAGLGQEVTDLLARLAVPQMVYISCDPSTLGRDLRALIDSGYRIEAMHLLDLFPQTFHLETITVLQR